MPVDTPLLDEAHVDELVAYTSDSFIRQLVESFTESAAPLLEELAAIDPIAEPVALRRKAHAIKSSAGNVGAKRLATLAANLEDAPPDTQSDELAEMIQQIRDSYAQTITALRHKLAADSSP